MPIKPQVLDSVDLKVLDEDTDPLTLVVGDKEYKLYLSDTHREELDKAIEKFVANEEPRDFARAVNPLPPKSSKKSSAESFSEWSKRMGHENDRQHFVDWGKGNGHELADRGQVSATFRKAYEEANGM